MTIFREILVCLFALMTGVMFLPVQVMAQGLAAVDASGAKWESAARGPGTESQAEILPLPVSSENFAELFERSPFLRTLNISMSLILTGVARIEGVTVATMVDLESGVSYTLFQGEASDDGWQLMEVKGDPSDLETLTAKVKIGGTEVVSVRYDKSPKRVKAGGGALVSTRIGNGTAGGGTGPHGGPDPRVLTPDQLADAREGARNIRGGFQADGYPDNSTIPPEVVNKLSRLSVDQRESVNVKMYEYRNRGLGMPERQKIYNNLLDKQLERR